MMIRDSARPTRAASAQARPRILKVRSQGKMDSTDRQ